MGAACCGSRERAPESVAGPGLGSNITIVVAKFNEVGLKTRVAEHLASGQPILCQCPSPGPYAIIAADPAIVNQTKGRSGAQVCARLIGSVDEILPILDGMGEKALEEAKRYLEIERMTVLLPVKSSFGRDNNDEAARIDGQPQILVKRSESIGVDIQKRKSQAFGCYALFFKMSVPDIDALCSQERPLYVSSGNAHELPMAQSFAEAIKQFATVECVTPVSLLALDADFLRDSSKHESTSMMRITAEGDCELTRHGYHNFAENWDSKRWRLTEEDWKKWTMH